MYKEFFKASLCALTVLSMVNMQAADNGSLYPVLDTTRSDAYDDYNPAEVTPLVDSRYESAPQPAPVTGWLDTAKNAVVYVAGTVSSARDLFTKDPDTHTVPVLVHGMNVLNTTSDAARATAEKAQALQAQVVEAVDPSAPAVERGIIAQAVRAIRKRVTNDGNAQLGIHGADHPEAKLTKKFGEKVLAKSQVGLLPDNSGVENEESKYLGRCDRANAAGLRLSDDLQRLRRIRERGAWADDEIVEAAMLMRESKDLQTTCENFMPPATIAMVESTRRSIRPLVISGFSSYTAREKLRRKAEAHFYGGRYNPVGIVIGECSGDSEKMNSILESTVRREFDVTPEPSAPPASPRASASDEKVVAYGRPGGE
jgi:hypothetical protein